ncbi:MAG: 4-hydroxythreonine-4-phosphate dehydrogenase PdxA, partial [Deltaproteobacteria bacterium]|nr:4-hydroxythreonine-4-phosphate dehydrogenase PdxA [Deltaproteobacteria bacterium]
MNKPVIAITMGDPAGVGPELSLKAATSLRVKRVARPLIIGDNGVLTRVAKKLKIKMPPQSSIISLSHLKATEFKAAHPSVKSSRAAISYIEEAVRLAQSGAADGIVTSPINKDALRHAGFKYPGHTEFLAHLTKTKDFVMMLGGDSLKVTLVTIHEPIKKVPELLTKESILKVIKITDASFKKFYKIKKPRIAVCGLNPHAGEPHGG